MVALGLKELICLMSGFTREEFRSCAASEGGWEGLAVVRSAMWEDVELEELLLEGDFIDCRRYKTVKA